MTQRIKNLKMVSTILLLGSTIILSMTSCGNQKLTSLSSTKLSYDLENDQVSGTLSYEEVSQNIKIVTLEQNEEQKSREEIRHYGEFNVVKEESFLNILLDYTERKSTHRVEDILAAYEERNIKKQQEKQGEIKIYGKEN